MSKLTGIYGHDLIRERLYKSAKEQKLLNSYIFEGPVGSGKKTLADIFIAAVMCTKDSDYLPCGKCDACKKVFSHNHPDVLYVEKDEGKKTIGVSKIRDNVIANVYIKPLVANKKFVVIKDGGALSEQAQNSLLKVLEEPPEYLSFIIITESSDFLLKTVLSRSVVFPFMPLSEEQLEKIFIEYNNEIDKNETRFAASFSQGIPGRGLEILQNKDFSRLYTETVEKVLRFLNGKISITSMQKHLAQEKDNINLVIDFCQMILRDILLVKLGKTELVVSKNHIYEIEKLAFNLSEKELTNMIEAVLEYQERLDLNAGFLVATMDMLLKLSENIEK